MTLRKTGAAVVPLPLGKIHSIDFIQVFGTLGPILRECAALPAWGDGDCWPVLNGG
jgi:hypothetical protein